MHVPFYSVYLAWGSKDYLLGMSPNPRLDARFWQERRAYRGLTVLTYPLPVIMADWVLRVLQGDEDWPQPRPWPEQGQSRWRRWLWRPQGKGGEGALVPRAMKHVTAMAQALARNYWREARRLLAREALSAAYLLTEVTPVGDLPPAMEVEALRGFLAGRALLLHELRQAARYTPALAGLATPLEELLQVLVLGGECRLKPALERTGWGSLECRRCGETQAIGYSDCLACHREDCAYCEACLVLGEARGCHPYFFMSRLPGGKDGEKQEGGVPLRPRLKFALSHLQAEAAVGLADFVRRQREKTALLWAVCGAGKTEIVFEALGVALATGNVLFTVPRREVVLELALRLQQAFPGVPCLVLHGETQPEERYREARLVLATTHQVLRFYQAFSLVILDEVDAFPYRGSRLLQRGVSRARATDGQIIYMSATPGEQLLGQARREGWPLFWIPVRPHGYPLPEPELVIVKLQAQPVVSLPPAVIERVEAAQRQGYHLFIFVPTVALTEAVAAVIQTALTTRGLGAEVLATHAHDPWRAHKQAAFRTGKAGVLVTTTVAERGLTVPRAAVMVLFAHTERIFTPEVLMQIAGRVGRSEECPTGPVWFVAPQVTPAMRAALAAIVACNREARQRGLLRVA